MTVAVRPRVEIPCQTELPHYMRAMNEYVEQFAKRIGAVAVPFIQQLDDRHDSLARHIKQKSDLARQAYDQTIEESKPFVAVATITAFVAGGFFGGWIAVLCGLEVLKITLNLAIISGLFAATIATMTCIPPSDEHYLQALKKLHQKEVSFIQNKVPLLDQEIANTEQDRRHLLALKTHFAKVLNLEKSVLQESNPEEPANT